MNGPESRKHAGDLVQAYLDGSLSEREARALRNWLRDNPERMRAFARQAHVHAMLCERALGMNANRDERRNTRQRKSIRFVWPLALAASLLAAAGVFWFAAGPGRPVPPVAALVLTELSGEIELLRRDGQTLAGHIGMAVGPGDEVRTGARAQATLSAPDTADLIRLDALASLTMTQEPHSYFLAAGRLNVSVPSLAGRVVVFETANARATVTGTRFELVAAPNLTRATVNEGFVTLRDLDRDVFVEVGAGQTSVVAPWAPPASRSIPLAEGLLALYLFNEGSGTVVHDVSGLGTPMDLTIGRPDKTEWLPDGLRILGEARLASRPSPDLSAAFRENNGFSVDMAYRPIGLPHAEKKNLLFMAAPVNGISAFWIHHQWWPSSDANSEGDYSSTVSARAAYVMEREETQFVFRTHVHGMPSQVDFYRAHPKGIRNATVDRIAVAPTLEAEDRKVNRAPWHGDLEFLAVYGRPLSDAEIGELAAESLSGQRAVAPSDYVWDFKEPPDPDTFKVHLGEWRHIADAQCMETSAGPWWALINVPLPDLPVVVETEVSVAIDKTTGTGTRLILGNILFDRGREMIIMDMRNPKAFPDVRFSARSPWSRPVTSHAYATESAIIRGLGDHLGNVVFYDETVRDSRLVFCLTAPGNAPLRIHRLAIRSVPPEAVPDIAVFRAALDSIPKEERLEGKWLERPDPRPGETGSVHWSFDSRPFKLTPFEY